MPAEFPNISKLLGEKYKIEYDEAYKYAPRDEKEDFAYIPCQYGQIYYYGNSGVLGIEDMLAFICTGPKIAGKIKRQHPEFRDILNAEDAAIFLFKREDFKTIKKYAKPTLKHKKKLTREHIKKMQEGRKK